MSEADLARFVQNRSHWAVSNPALGIRIAEETIEGELVDLSPRSFARERLNMWPTATAGAVRAISEKHWKANAITAPDDAWPIASFGLDMNLERTKVTITPCLWAGEDELYVEVAADSPFSDAGTSALVDWIKERAKRRHPVVIDAMSPARSLEAHLKKVGIKVFILNASEYAQACMNFHDGVKEGNVLHFDQVQLTNSVTKVIKEPLGKSDSWKFGRSSLSVDLGPAVSAACAFFGALKFARKPRNNADSADADDSHGFF